MTQAEHDLQALVQRQVSVFQLSDIRLRAALIVALRQFRGQRR